MSQEQNYEGMSMKELVETYNEKAEQWGNPADFQKAKSFKSKEIAIKRLELIDAALEGEGEEEPAPKKNAKKAAKKRTKKTSTDKEIEDLIDAPKKKRGRKPSFEYEASEKQTEPREGTLRADCLDMLREGCTIEELEAKMVEYRDAKGAEWKVTPRYRALEILKLLSQQNGFGFTEEDGKIWAVVPE